MSKMWTRARSVMLASTAWIFLIALGAIIVAIGNIQFNLARDREKGAAASSKALTMIAGESIRNLNGIQEMRQFMGDKKIRIRGFETTAWSVVSSGGLLVQTDKDVLEEITQAYYFVELANKYHGHLLDLTQGMLSVIGGAEHTRAQYMALLSNAMDAVEPKLQSIISSQKKIAGD